MHGPMYIKFWATFSPTTHPADVSQINILFEMSKFYIALTSSDLHFYLELKFHF